MAGKKQAIHRDGYKLKVQLFSFSFKATAEIMTMCFWELAKNQDVQNQLKTEVDKALETLNNNEITCEEIKQLDFLDAVILETLRKWPSITSGSRVCNKDCSITTRDGELLKFNKGDIIQIPFKLLQNDAKYYANPVLFDPCRFTKDKSRESFLAFGVGPRNCDGMQYVLQLSKSLIFKILSKYSVQICDKTPKLISQSNDIIFLELIRRENKLI